MINLKRNVAALLATACIAPAVLAHTAYQPNSPQQIKMLQRHAFALETMIDPNGNRSYAMFGKQPAPAKTFLDGRIKLSGILNLDATYWDRGWSTAHRAALSVVPSFQAAPDHSTTDFKASNLTLMLDAKINHYIRVHTSLTSYQRVGFISGYTPVGVGGQPNLRYPIFDEAYITLGKKVSRSNSLVYFRAGREYLPFGHYGSPYALTESFTQLLTETNGTALQLGFANPRQGAYGGMFLFTGMHSLNYNYNSDLASGTWDPSETEFSSNLNNFGGNLGYRVKRGLSCYEASASYINDMRDVNFVETAFDDTNGAPESDQVTMPGQRAGGISVHVHMRRGPFLLAANYVTALKAMDPDATHGDTKPQAWDVSGDYRLNRISKLGISYQESKGVENFSYMTDSRTGVMEGKALMPRSRIQLDYDVSLGKNANFAIQFNRNKDFESLTGLTSSVVKARLAMHF